MPIVSVILPFYNAESTLDRAIKSIVSQKDVDFELILCHNNSADRSLEVASKWEQSHPKILLTEESTQGVVYASNKAASLVESKYLSRMDADDIALPGKLKKQVHFLENHPDIGLVAGLARYKTEMKDTAGFSRYVAWSNSITGPEDIKLKRFIESPIINPTAIWRRDIGEHFGLYRSGDFPEDYEMWLRWLNAGVRMAKIDEYVLEWHDSPARLTRTDPLYSEQAFYRIKSHYLKKWLERHNPYHPQVCIWGASRKSRKRITLLEAEGIDIVNYFDINDGRQLDKPVFHFSELPEAGTIFLLIYQAHQEVREEIRDFLIEKRYTEGKDYLFAS